MLDVLFSFMVHDPNGIMASASDRSLCCSAWM